MFSTLPRTACIRLISSWFSVLLLATNAQIVSADQLSTEEWNISADKVVRYDDPDSIVAQGNVTLEKKEKQPLPSRKTKSTTTAWSDLLEEGGEKTEMVADDVVEESTPVYKTTVTIRADWMVYDVELQSIKAKGQVKITTEDDQLFAKEAVVNLENETGKFTDATILRDRQSIHLEGKTIEKTGFDTYRITDGWIITCKLEDGEIPPWSFSSSNVNVRQNGYAVLTNAKFNIKNVPVFYSPYLVVPVKNTRQTGFIFPEFSSSSNNGFGINLPFFLDISDSIDATLFPEYLTNRGFMPGLELRYVSSASDKGMFTSSYLDDKLSTRDDSSGREYYRDTGYTHDNSDRYWVRGKSDNTIAGWQSRVDIDVVSDQDYLNEFDTGITGFTKSQQQYLDIFGRGFQNQTDTFRQNTAKILKSWDGMSLEANLLAINDADTRSPDTDTPLWKLPSVDFTGALPIGDTFFSFDWNADYVNYWREDGVGGHRVDLYPSISTPVPLGPYLESRAEVFLRDTFYMVETYGDAEWQNDDTQNRLLPEFEAEVATTLERDYFGKSSTTRAFSHQLRPFIQYGYIEDVDQQDLPFFDDVDYIEAKNAITYGIDNFFNLFDTADGGREIGREYGYLQVSQAYDLRNESSDEPFSDISGRLRWTPNSNTSVGYKTLYDVYESKFVNHLLESSIANSRGDMFSLEYSLIDGDAVNQRTANYYLQDSNIRNDPYYFQDTEQINAAILAHIIGGWMADAKIEHSLSNDETVRASGSLIYQALCWAVKFETRYTPADTTYLLTFELANIGVPLGVNF